MIIQELWSRFFWKIHALFPPSTPNWFSPSKKDIFLVSYPRSGNTWLRSLLAEILYGKSGNSFEELQYFIPDIHIKIEAEKVMFSEFHVVKSHNPLRYRHDSYSYKKVIYLIRDPRDVVLSYHRYFQKYKYPYDLDQFIIDCFSGRIWPCSWHEHVQSWLGLGSGINNSDLFLIRFEDLVADTNVQLYQLLNHFEIESSEDAIIRAINKTTPEKMRIKELNSFIDQELEGDFRFIGKAISNQWKIQLTKEQVDYFHLKIGSLMSTYGYD